MKKNERRKRIFASVIALAIVVAMVLGLAISMVHAEEAEKTEETGDTTLEAVTVTSGKQTILSNGVYIDNIDVTNLSLSETQKALGEHLEELKKESIILYAGNKSTSVTAGDLGLDYSNKSVIEEALSIGKKGNVLKRFLADKQIREQGPIVLDLDLTVDQAKVKKIIKEKKQVLDCDPQPNGMILNDDRTFSIMPAEEGVSVKESTSANALIAYMEESWHGGQGGVKLDAEIIPSEDRSDQLRNVRNLLGTASTAFDVSDEGRTTNITIATNNIDGTVLFPGEEFSSIKAIGPTTEEYGFALGASFADDALVDTYGGGVCQVTSTLYGAVLEAELEVTERHNHTMLVSYVAPAFDATISEDTVDFKFKNSTDAPIYIQATAEEGTVTFNIYGDEYRPQSRTIQYENRILTTTDYETVYRVDNKAEFGVVSEISGKEGVQAELWKIIYQNGEYESEEKVNSSTYSPMNHSYHVGIIGASDATVDAIYNAVSSGSLDAIYSAVGNGTRIETIDVQED